MKTSFAFLVGLALVTRPAVAQGPAIQLDGNRSVQLERLIDSVEHKAVGKLLAARHAFLDVAKYKSARTPDVADTLKDQTPIKNQGARATCTYFAATAALEAAYKKAGVGNLDLSEQYLVWLRNVTMLTDDKQPAPPALTDPRAHENQLGSLGGGSSVYNVQLMTHYGIGLSANYPYIGTPDYENTKSKYYTGFALGAYKWDNPRFPQLPIDAWNMAPNQSPLAIEDGPRYGVDSYVALDEAQYKDPRCIEYLIANGYSVPIDITLFKDPTTPQRPIWTRNQALDDQPTGGHAVLIVGYDRRRHFFVIKNSWGPMHYDANKLAPGLKDIATKYDGYYLMDYNYLTGAYGASFITAVTKPGSSKFANQSLLGGWTLKVTRKQDGSQLFLGRLTWRHMPGTDVNMAEKELRIGDLYGKLTGAKDQIFRVNAEVGNVVSVYVDFDHPAQGLADRAGLRFSGRVINQGGHLSLADGSVSGTGRLGGIDARELEFTLVHA
ncbi:MAG TPA: hypothetical protein VKT78_18505 [Fimbriimonadaceae bacterium]|nr:hypothetical protein [Fimbriimonadaceae bacterium]